MEQGIPYWYNFLNHYPSISDLALATESQVLKIWEGLGYYSRARNLHATAKYIHFELKGDFPDTYEKLLKLKGVGPYTAAAIASICFNEPTPVVDGNVYRFAARYFGLEHDISKSGTRKIFERHLEKHISNHHPDLFNQAMMEMGARVCTPKPNCQSCPFTSSCFAKKNQMVDFLPHKSKKLKVRERYLNYIIFSSKETVLMKERRDGDVWEGLFDFYVIEGKFEEEFILGKISHHLSDFSLENISPEIKHILSHQKLFARFFRVVTTPMDLEGTAKKLNLEIIKKEEVVNLPKPKLIVNYLKEYNL